MINSSSINSYAINEDESGLSYLAASIDAPISTLTASAESGNLISSALTNPSAEQTASGESGNDMTGDLVAGAYLADGYIGEIGASGADLLHPIQQVSGTALGQHFLSAAIDQTSPLIASVWLTGNDIEGDNIEPFDFVEGFGVAGIAIDGVAVSALPEITGEMLGGNDVVAPAPKVAAAMSAGQIFVSALSSPASAVASTWLTGNMVTAPIEPPQQEAKATLLSGYSIDADLQAPASDALSYAVVGDSLTADLSVASEVSGIVISSVIAEAAIVSAMPEVASIIRPAFVLPEIPADPEEDIVYPNGFTGYAMNADNYKVSRYPNFNPLAMARINGAYVSVTPDGIFLLDGDNDEGVPINARVRFGKDDFGSEQLKRVQYAYVGAQGEIEASMYVDGDRQTGAFDRTHGRNGLHQSRIKMGKGTKSRYWQPEITGSRFEIESVSLEPEVLSRRVA